MHRFKNLLYVSHGTSDEADGLKQALSLARNNNAPLRVQIICPEFPAGLPSYQKKYEEALLVQAKESITKARAELGVQDLAIDISLGLDSGPTPDLRVIQQVLKNGYDLVIKEVEPGSSSGFRAFDMSLLRKCPCPVWLWRPIHKSREDIRVAVAIDPEVSGEDIKSLTLRLLTLSRSLADSCSGELQVISCWDHPYESYLRSSVWSTLTEFEVSHSVLLAKKEHLYKLGRLIEEAEITGERTIHHMRGVAAELIPQFVRDKQIDILIMGTVARTGVPGFLIGNTAENIFLNLPCTVLALKPPGFVSPVKAYSQ